MKRKIEVGAAMVAIGLMLNLATTAIAQEDARRHGLTGDGSWRMGPVTTSDSQCTRRWFCSGTEPISLKPNENIEFTQSTLVNIACASDDECRVCLTPPPSARCVWNIRENP